MQGWSANKSLNTDLGLAQKLGQITLNFPRSESKRNKVAKPFLLAQKCMAVG